MDKKSPQQARNVPDGGYGWVICFSSFCVHLLLDGIGLCFGIFLQDYKQYFNTTVASVSLASSLLMGVVILQGPLVSMLVNRFGCRPVSMAGSIVAASAYILSTFSPSVEVFCLTFGFMGGMGFGMMILPTVIELGYYFERKQALSMGLATSGGGLGMLAMAPVVKYLHSETDWKTAHFVFAGLLLQGCVLAALMRPLSLPTKLSVIQQSNVREPDTVDKPCTDTLSVLPTYKDQSKSTGDLDVQVKFMGKERLHSSACDISMSAVRRDRQRLATPFYHLSGSTFELSQRVDSVSDEQQKSTTQKLHRMLYKVVDIQLLMNRDMLLFGVGNIFSMIGYFYLILYLPVKAIQLGISTKNASFLLSIFGISNTVGRLLSGILLDCIPNISSLLLHNICMFMAGLSMILSPLCTSYASMALVMAIYGFCISPFVSLVAVIACDLVGVEKLANAFGLTMLERGIAVVAGPPLGGWLYDTTGNYDATFYVGGACIITSAALYCLLHFIRYRRGDGTDSSASTQQ